MGTSYKGISSDRKESAARQDRKAMYRKNQGLQLLNLKRKVEALERRIKKEAQCHT